MSQDQVCPTPNRRQGTALAFKAELSEAIADIEAADLGAA
jgi:hypothetical protein